MVEETAAEKIAIAANTMLRSNREQRTLSGNSGDLVASGMESSPGETSNEIKSEGDESNADEIDDYKGSSFTRSRWEQTFGIASESFVDVGSNLSNSQQSLTGDAIPSSDSVDSVPTDLESIVGDETKDDMVNDAEAIEDESNGEKAEETKATEAKENKGEASGKRITFTVSKQEIVLASCAIAVLFLVLLGTVSSYHLQTVSKLKKEILLLENQQCESSLSIAALTNDLGDKIQTMEASLISNAGKVLEAAANATQTFSSWMSESIMNALKAGAAVGA